MYRIKYIKNNEVKLTNSNGKSSAKISLNDGASLKELYINNKVIIQDLTPLKYVDTYASSILFPFANRIKDGSYSFENKTYQLKINQREENNALHGLVYNKKFRILSEDVSENDVSIKLEYNEEKESKGFPFTYTIQLKYTLTENALKLSVSVKNTDSKSFPFTLGWHPYFTSKNLFDSSLQFDSHKKLVFDERMITIGVIDCENEGTFEIKNH